MNKTSKTILIMLVISMSFIIGVSAGGRWEGTEVVQDIRVNQVSRIRELFSLKDEKINKLEQSSGSSIERIGKLELQIHNLNGTIIAKDQEILIKVQKIQELENELSEAYNDVLGIQGDLSQLISENE